MRLFQRDPRHLRPVFFLQGIRWQCGHKKRIRIPQLASLLSPSLYFSNTAIAQTFCIPSLHHFLTPWSFLGADLDLFFERCFHFWIKSPLVTLWGVMLKKGDSSGLIMECLEGNEINFITWHEELLTRSSQRINPQEFQHNWGGFKTSK